MGPSSQGHGDANAHRGELRWLTKEAILMLDQTTRKTDVENRVFTAQPTISRRVFFFFLDHTSRFQKKIVAFNKGLNITTSVHVLSDFVS